MIYFGNPRRGLWANYFEEYLELLENLGVPYSRVLKPKPLSLYEHLCPLLRTSEETFQVKLKPVFPV
jgi:hypothetical protein